MRVIPTIVLITLVYQIQAQNFLSWKYSDRYFSAALGSGNTMYIGELNSTNRIQQDLSHVSLGLEARLWSKVAARTELVYYQLRGNDRFAEDSTFQEQRNLSFRSNNLEFSIQGVFYMRKYRGDYYRRWAVDPYIAVGAGFTTFNPKTEYQGQFVELRPLQTENVSYSTVTMIIPAAAGLKLKINEFINLNFEIMYRYTFTDYLDDVSGTYPTEPLSGPLAEALSNRKDEIPIVNAEAYDALVPGNPRGDSSDNDQYLFLSIKIEFYLPRGSSSIFSKPGAY